MGDGMKRGVGDDPFADDVTDDVKDESPDDVEEVAPAQDDVASAQSASEQTDSAPEQTGEYSFSAGVVDAIEAIEAGEENKNISIRDRDMKALLLALEGNYEARFNVTDALDLDEEAPRSDIVRGLLRVGLAEAAPAVQEELGEAIAEHARDSL